MPTVAVNGARLAYDAAGDGPAVVFLHVSALKACGPC
jgi:hypothetical protein